MFSEITCVMIRGQISEELLVWFKGGHCPQNQDILECKVTLVDVSDENQKSNIALDRTLQLHKFEPLLF